MTMPSHPFPFAIALAFAAIASPVSAATFVPPEGSSPQETVGGASRTGDSCPEDPERANTLVALVPSLDRVYTVDNRPTIFVYVSETSATQAYFSLEDDEYTPLAHFTVPVPEGGGLVAVPVPEDAAAEMETGQEYRWLFTLKCNNRIQAGYPLVAGRIDLYDGEPPTPETSPREVAHAYGQAGIWYDGLEILISAWQSDPDTLMHTIRTLRIPWIGRSR